MTSANTGAMLYQLSYEATHFGAKLTPWLSPHEEWNEHCTSIRWGHGFEFHWSPNFLRLLFYNCLNWKIYCDDYSALSKQTFMHVGKNWGCECKRTITWCKRNLLLGAGVGVGVGVGVVMGGPIRKMQDTVQVKSEPKRIKRYWRHCFLHHHVGQ